MSEELIYQPSKWGQEFHDLVQDEALGAGAAGCGKTWVLLMETLPQIYTEHERCTDPNHPHPLKWGESRGRGLYIRRTTNMLAQVIGLAKAIYPKLDPNVKFHVGPPATFTFASGYKDEFGHCKDPDDWQIYQGQEYSIIRFDELTQILEEQYNQIRSRLRSADPVLKNMLKVRSMSNPTMVRDSGEDFVVRDPFWVRKKFVDRDPRGRRTWFDPITFKDGSKGRHTWIYLPATLADNPDAEFRRSYEKTLQSMPAHLREALLEGNWYFVAGGYYADAWRSRLHTCEPFAVPDDWPKFRSMDWGYRTPGCIHWYARSPEGVLFVYFELKFKMLKADMVAKRIAEIEKRLGLWDGTHSRITGPADTQIWGHQGTVGKSVAATFREYGVGWKHADKLGGSGKNKFGRSHNARRLLERLRDHNDGTTEPGIVFFKNCRYAIRTIPAILVDSNDSECPQKGGDDHAHDSVLYGVAYASKHAGTATKRRRGRGDDDDDDGPKRKRAGRGDRGPLGYG